MARPTNRTGTGNAQFVRRIPADLLPRLRGRTVTFSLPSGEFGVPDLPVKAKVGLALGFSLQTASPSLVKVRHAAVTAQVEALFKAERSGPAEMSFKDVQALAGVAYREIIAEHEDNPGRTEDWELFRSAVADAAEFLDSEGYKPTQAEEALGYDVSGFLTRHGLNLTVDSRAAFVRALILALSRAGGVLIERAEGNYRPDLEAERFPEWSGQAPTASQTGRVNTFDDLFSRWKAEATPSPNTVSTWEGHLRRFKKHLGHDDPHRVTQADVLRWKDALLAEGRKQVNKSYLAAIKALYAYGVKNAATSGIKVNPVVGVSAMQKKRAGEGRLPYEDADVSTILLAARAKTVPALRWIPWLTAQTGARVGEIAQLWGSMVVERKGVPCLILTPAEDGGRMKNEGSERVVPLHPEVIAEGFLDFVKARGDGPLFYGASGRKAARARTDGASRHPSKGPANRVAAWIRKLGFTDPRLAPNHSFRHWLKTALMDTGCSDSLADMIQGHAPKSEGDGYRHGRVPAMLEALSKVRLVAEPTTRADKPRS